MDIISGGNGSAGAGNNSANIYYYNATGKFWMLNSRGQWCEYNESACKRELKSMGLLSKAAEGEFLSQVDEAMHKVQKENDVAYAGELAGVKMGVHNFYGSRALITIGPNLIEAKEGDWSLIRLLIEGLFKDEMKDQTPYVYGWIKWALEAVYSGINKPGQALIMAGPARCGKSFFQNYVITPLLGGRVAKPYTFMTGQTPFNSHLFRAEHLMIEDESPSTDYRSRQNFGTSIKSMCVNTVQECAGKHKTNLMLPPIWRITGSLNDDPIHMLTLPPLEESIKDKLILLRANTFIKSMPTDTSSQREAYLSKITGQLGAFVHWINDYDIPHAIRCPYGSYGVTHYHHPELVRAIDEQSSELKLMSLIDSRFFSIGGSGPIEETANDIERMLKEPESSVCYEARNLMKFNNACGVFLSALSQKMPDRVMRMPRIGSSPRMWRIMPDGFNNGNGANGYH